MTHNVVHGEARNVVLTTADSMAGIPSNKSMEVDVIRVRCSSSYNEEEAFEKAKTELRQKAYKLGGDAVIAIAFKFETNLVRATGTVVKINRD